MRGGEGHFDIIKAHLPKNKTNPNQSKSKQQKDRVLITMSTETQPNLPELISITYLNAGEVRE